MKTTVFCLSCLLSWAALADSYNIATYRVFGPEHPGRLHPVQILIKDGTVV